MTSSGLFPLPEVNDEQLSLLGTPREVRTPATLWEAWLTNPATRARFETKRYDRGPGSCAPWLAAISSTGHASFRAASRPGPSRRGTVPAHLYAYQLEYGIIDRLGWTALEDPVLRHRCDYPGCVNPHHLQLGSIADNRADYLTRRHTPGSPLADVRGPAGLSRAIATAVRDGLAAHEPAPVIDERINAAIAAGQPWALW